MTRDDFMMLPPEAQTLEIVRRARNGEGAQSIEAMTGADRLQIRHAFAAYGYACPSGRSCDNASMCELALTCRGTQRTGSAAEKADRELATRWP